MRLNSRGPTKALLVRLAPRSRKDWISKGNLFYSYRQVLRSDKEVERLDDMKEGWADGGRQFQREGPATKKDLDLAIVVVVRGTESSRLSRERTGRRDEAEVGSCLCFSGSDFCGYLRQLNDIEWMNNPPQASLLVNQKALHSKSKSHFFKNSCPSPPNPLPSRLSRSWHPLQRLLSCPSGRMRISFHL